MIIVSIFLENVSQLEMEEEFVKLTEVVLKFELKRMINFFKMQLSILAAVFFGAIYFVSSLRSCPTFHCNLFY